MNPNPKPLLPRDTVQIESLANAIKKSEQARELVEESADELASVNDVLGNEIPMSDAGPALQTALKKSKAVEGKVQLASGTLSQVNRALENEVRDRRLLDHQFAAVTEQEEAARHAAFHDVLTNLPNRVLFNDRLEHGFAQAKRHGWTLAVMFLDLDNFKAINDQHGHEFGDGVLQLIAERLKENSRGDDTVSRHGGDEFLYLLNELHDEADIAAIAQKTIETVRAPFALIGQAPAMSVGLSVGIAVYPRDGNTAAALIKNADRAMYRAKREKTGYAFASLCGS